MIPRRRRASLDFHVSIPSAITLYFGAEKSEALLFIAVGVAALTLSVVLWRRRSRLRGMIIPLVAIAAIQLVVGTTVYSRTEAQVASLQSQWQAAPTEFKAAEMSRMKAVMRNFEIYKIVEIALLASGLALVVALQRREFWFAFGLGLTLQSGFMLALDFFAERRGHDYLRVLLNG
jgi:hypothetical protein